MTVPTALERLIGSVRRECTDHLIAFNADHFAESLRNMPSIITRCERMFRSGRTRPAHARWSGSETELGLGALAGSIIGRLESRFRKRHPRDRETRTDGERSAEPTSDASE